MDEATLHFSAGARVSGLIPGEVAEIVAVTAIGTGAFLKFRSESGVPESRMLSADQLSELVPINATPLTLGADPEQFRLAIEAVRISRAHLLNPLLAVSSSNVEPLPHQVQAVYGHLLQRHPLRFLLADDPGAGKTVMAGLFIKEAMARGWLRRCLVVVPGSLAEQWQDELAEKFGLRFEIFETSLLERRRDGDEPLRDFPFLIVRLDQFARSPRLMDLIGDSTFDLAVIDEAHKLTARHWGGRLIKSRRFQFGERLRDACPSLLLMTATPHNGKEAEFQLFLSLLHDEGAAEHVADASGAGLMRRLVKEQLVHLDGSRLFPERRASTVGYRLTALERDLYDDVSEYVREEMNKVADDEARRTVGFALLVLQRRLASSPEAILRSLTRRRDRLQGEVTRLMDADSRLLDQLAASVSLQAPEMPDMEDLGSEDAETYEDAAASVATASRTLPELETEIAILDRLIVRAQRVRDARVDAKWEALADLLTSDPMYDDSGQRRKIIIFTEHRDTLDYLEQRLASLMPPGTNIEVIHGAIGRGDRKLAQVRFTQEPASSILLATDAAGEGVNLQVAHLMVNYDIPWNPNRLEQRFGRIHRIGQKHICHLWNLVALDTREGDVFHTLLTKLDVQREALGDQVFDVLGQVLTDASLGQLLSRALEGGSTVDIESALSQVANDIESAVRDRASSASTLTADELVTLRHQMEMAKAITFQPDVIRDFTLGALARFHGEVAPRGDDWQVRHVPERIREAATTAVPARYDLITFVPLDGSPSSYHPPELIAPGHPLLVALVEAVAREHGASLDQGALLVDDREDEDYVLITLETTDHEVEPSLSTLRVRADGSHEPVDPGLYTDLGSSVGPASPDEHHLVADATAKVIERLSPRAVRVLATAFVRGTAPREMAERWREARRLTREALIASCDHSAVVADGLAGQGWDFVVQHTGLSFVAASPAGAFESPRRSELRAIENLGARLERRTVGRSETS